MLKSIALLLLHITSPEPGKRAITNISILIGSINRTRQFLHPEFCKPGDFQIAGITPGL
jgi:hypothetical protein